MDVNKISNADFLDILFDGRNKEYGAYELRKNYNKRLTTAIVSTAGLSLLIFGLVIIGRGIANAERNRVRVQDVNLVSIKDDKPQQIETPKTPPPKKEPVKIQIDKVTPPKIVEDDKFNEKNEVKDQTEITNVGKFDQVGIKETDYVNPPKVDQETKVVEGPKQPVDDAPFTKVEIEAQFPGGDAKWSQFVQKEVERHMDELTEDGQSGTCEVQFIVDREGNVSNVDALSMKGTKLAEVAVNAIKRGPKWIPAIQNGQPVKAWRRQKITFRLPDERP